MALRKIKLGELIEQTYNRNTELSYGEDDVMGMTISKKIIPTKADVGGTDLSKFLIVNPNEFIYNPRTHGKRIGLGFNDFGKTFIISWNNIAFKIKENAKELILPEYLYMMFNRSEWDRKACFDSWGSSTEVFTWEALSDMDIELPDLPTQEKFVNIYKAMVENQKAYERGLDDLKLVCDGYIEDLRKRMPCKEIGKYLSEKKEINRDCKIKKLYGLTNNLGFQKPSSMSDGVDISRYKCVYKDDIVYPPPHFGEIGTIGLFNYDEGVVSPMYIVFEIKDKNILDPEYLFMWFKRSEFMRYAFFASCDSIRDTFDFSKLCEYAIPLPDIKIQKAIASIYKCYLKRKEINEKLKQQIKNLCPILIKGSIEEAK